jgi:hypothetical protein
MTSRDRKLASGFLIVLGALGLLFSSIELLTLSPPPPTNSAFRGGLSELLAKLFGIPYGYVIFHIIFGVVSACMLWIGITVRR